MSNSRADVALAVCLLFAAGRPTMRSMVAEWATQKDEASGTLLAGMVDALSRENLEAQEAAAACRPGAGA